MFRVWEVNARLLSPRVFTQQVGFAYKTFGVFIVLKRQKKRDLVRCASLAALCVDAHGLNFQRCF